MSTDGGGASGAATIGAQAPGLKLSGIAKTFGDRTVLHPFDLQIQAGEIHALLGQNGSGKSTLIKILSGFHVPDGGMGVCEIAGQALAFGDPHESRSRGVRVVHQDLGLIAESSVLDNLSFTRGFATRALTIRGKTEYRRAQQTLEAVGLNIDPKAWVSSLTPAQCTGVAVARAIDPAGGAAALLILDEPTATLPAEEVEHLHSIVRGAAAQGVSILYVTHHLEEVFALADRVSVLRDGHLVESAPVSGIDRDTLVHRLVGAELEKVQRTATPARHDSKPALLRVDGLTSDYLKGVSLVGRAGEIVGLYGPTGSGRESVLGAIFGALPRQQGTVSIDETPIPPFSPPDSIAAGIGYLSPDRKTSGGFLHLTAAENISLTRLRPFWRRGFLRTKLELTEVRQMFERMQVSPRDGTRATLAQFSGGNQQKIVLAKWLRLSLKALLLDEPTQGVDVGAKAELHRQIIEASGQGTLIVVSSTEIEELVTLCDRVIIMSAGRFAVELIGDEVTEENINLQFHNVA